MAILDYDNDIRPFFQVLINSIDDKFVLTQFVKSLKKTIKENNSNTHHIEIKDIEDSDENFIAFHLIHKSTPTWYKPAEGKTKRSEILTDSENDLLLVYTNKNYLFVHTNCNQIATLVNETIELLKESQAWKMDNLSAQKINIVLQQLELEYRSLGIQNVFNAGGSSPEAKTYYGRNTSTCLTPSFDGGFGFSYCLGAVTDKDNNRKPFGCSSKKSKIWTTWVDNLDDFCGQCDEIIKWLTSSKKTSKKDLDVLVKAVDKSNINSANAINFYLDYYIKDKGMVGLEGSFATLDWNCFLLNDKKDTIVFSLENSEKAEIVELKYSYDTKNQKFDFSYADKTKHLSIFFEKDDSKQTSRKDLVDFLNKQKHFTVLYDNAHAYRDNECWVNNRLTTLFNNCYKDITWSDVDITKEDKPSSIKGKINIIQKVESHAQSGLKADLIINDNGANEIADCLILTNNKVILVHAKYSSKHEVGLRVDDLQVVCSQALKNIKYFFYTSYSSDIIQRLYNKLPKGHSFKDVDDFKNNLLEKIQDSNIQKECWIVQPGISSKKLEKDTTNKIHILLNFIDNIHRMNNVQFKVFTS